MPRRVEEKEQRAAVRAMQARRGTHPLFSNAAFQLCIEADGQVLLECLV